MSLQARMSEGDPRLYNANRDLAHCWPEVVKIVAQRLDAGAWPAVEAYLSSAGCDNEGLAKANAAFIDFVRFSLENPKETMMDVLARAGWFAAPAAAQVAYMAYLGTVIAGITFAGVRESTLGGVGPLSGPKTIPDLIAAGRESSRLIAMSRWRRPIARLWARIKRVRNALRNQ